MSISLRNTRHIMHTDQQSVSQESKHVVNMRQDSWQFVIFINHPYIPTIIFSPKTHCEKVTLVTLEVPLCVQYLPNDCHHTEHLSRQNSQLLKHIAGWVMGMPNITENWKICNSCMKDSRLALIGSDFESLGRFQIKL